MSISKLTIREIEVLEKLASGLTIKEIAVECGIAYGTAKYHRGNITKKLNSKTIAHAVSMLIQHKAEHGDCIKYNDSFKEQLLKQIESGATYEELMEEFKVSRKYLANQLKKMGFDGLIDARRVMRG